MRKATRIVVISDTHGKIDHIIPIIKDLDVDMIFHLGDNVKDAKAIHTEINKKIVYVKGNCDYFVSRVNEDEIVNISGKKIFLTHGHKYSVKSNVGNLFYKGKEIEADLVLFGHTHRPFLDEYENIIIFNPGSASLARGGSKESIGLLEIDDEIKIKKINL